MSVWRTVVTFSSPSLGGVGTNTWHFRTTSTATEGEETDQLQSATDNLETFYAAIASATAGGTAFNAAGIWTIVSDDSHDQRDVSGWTTGSGGGNPLPPFCSLVIGWRSTAGDRSSRGRTFIGPASIATLQSNGTPEETSRTQLETAASDLIAASDGPLNGQFVVWSKQENVGRDFTSAAVRNVFGSLRSRRD